MTAATIYRFSDREILARRGKKNLVQAERPYAFFVEQEPMADGQLADVAVVLLTNRECPFRCLMCDLWKNTLDQRVPDGSITRQVDYALARLPPVHHVKLYNSGNFFDAQAIPPSEHSALAERLSAMRTVIVENHPRLCGESCRRFRELLAPTCELEVAIGLETVHPEILASLNKQMTVADFDQAVQYLAGEGIFTRAFILLRPPYMTESQGIHWALESMRHAYSVGVRCCSVIPTRAGNGVMERLQSEGSFAPPQLRSLESVLETALGWQQGRAFADLWDADQLPACPQCQQARRQRIADMNRTQTVTARIACPGECGA